MKAQGAIEWAVPTTRTLRGQGATEYLVLLSVVLMIVLVCIAILVWPTGSTKDVKQSQSDLKCNIAAMGQADLLQGLAAYYKFDEESGTLVYPKRAGTVGTLAGDTTWVTGKSKTAMSFDGAGDYISINDSDALDLTGDFTIALWAKSYTNGSSNASLAQQFMGVNKKTSSYSQQTGWEFYHLTAPYSRIDFYGAGNSFISATGIPADVGNWHFYTFIGTRGDTQTSIKIYYDTTLKLTGNVDNFVGGTDSLRIGVGDPGSYSNGTMDEVIIFNRALSTAEMQFLYQYPGCP